MRPWTKEHGRLDSIPLNFLDLQQNYSEDETVFEPIFNLYAPLNACNYREKCGMKKSLKRLQSYS